MIPMWVGTESKALTEYREGGASPFRLRSRRERRRPPHKVGRLDLHDLGFLASGDCVNFLDVRLSDLLQTGVASL